MPEAVGVLLRDIERTLAAGLVEAPRVESRDMLAALLDVNRSWPMRNAEAPVAPELRAAALRAAAMRIAGAPQAYCVGRATFRHITLSVDERVLIPRPETELLVDIVLQRLVDRPGGVAIDVGTGSGAIALSLACEGSLDEVIGTDVSLDALAVARANMRALAPRLRATVELRHGAFLAPVAGMRVRAIVSNPPYIAPSEAASLPASVRDWEPPEALFSGDEGMDCTRRLIHEAGACLEPGGILALEVDSRRAALAAAAVSANRCYRAVEVLRDLTGRERFVVAHRTEAE